MKHSMRWFLAGALALAATAAWGTFHTCQIEELYLNADGTVQFAMAACRTIKELMDEMS